MPCEGCLGLSPTISSQFTVEMCTAVKKCEKNSPKPPFGNVHGRLRSPMLTNLRTSACYDMQHVCAYLQPFYATRDNCDKITTFWGGGREVAVFDAHLRQLPET